MWFVCQVGIKDKGICWRIKRASSFYTCVRFYFKRRNYVYKVFPLSEYFLQKLTFWQGIRGKNWGHFFEKLHALLARGETLLTALKVLKEDKNLPQTWIDKVFINLKNGLFIGPLWEEEEIPLSKSQKYLLQCAEQGGFLTQGVSHVKEALKLQTRVKKQIRRGLIYPGCVFCVMIFFMCILSLFLLKNVEIFFKEQAIEPGVFTKLIFSANHYFIPCFFSFLWIIFVLFVFLKVKRITLLDKIERFIEKRCRYLQYSIFAMNLAEFLENKFPMVESVRMSLENLVDKVTMNNVLLKLNNGKTLSEILFFMPKEFCLSIQNGEISGEVVETLKQLSKTYYQRYEEKLSQWTKFIEPLCLISIAIFVFLLVMAIFGPLIQLFDNINLS